jgi:hypothetical protein
MGILGRSRGSGESRNQFWERLADELGTPIVAHTLGRYLSGAREPGPLWGIFYCTAEALYFRHFAQRSWISSLATLGSDDEDSRRPVHEQEVVLHIPFGTVAEVVPPPVRSWFGRFVHGDEGLFMLRREESFGEQFVFFVEQDPVAFAAAIAQGVAAARR